MQAAMLRVMWRIILFLIYGSAEPGPLVPNGTAFVMRARNLADAADIGVSVPVVPAT